VLLAASSYIGEIALLHDVRSLPWRPMGWRTPIYQIRLAGGAATKIVATVGRFPPMEMTLSAPTGRSRARKSRGC